MNTISQTPFAGGMQQLFAAGSNAQTAAQAPSSSIQGSATRAAQSITSTEGQSLVDIRDELASAAQAAYDSFDGEGDIRSTVRDAIRATLTENGFDVEEVESAMGPKPGAGGRPPRGEGPPPSDAGSESFGERFVQSFLGRFSEGTNLDFIG
jgi:hypothetical protein